MQEKTHQAILIESKDNVAVAIENLEKSSQVVVKGKDYFTVKLLESVKFGHKFATRPILAGDKIIKYGHIIGIALENIEIGQHVHDHNIGGTRGRGDLNKSQ